MKRIHNLSLREGKSTGKFELLVRFLFIFLCCMSVTNLQAQQNINVTGSVTDNQDQPIIGASYCN